MDTCTSRQAPYRWTIPLTWMLFEKLNSLSYLATSQETWNVEQREIMTVLLAELFPHQWEWRRRPEACVWLAWGCRWHWRAHLLNSRGAESHRAIARQWWGGGPWEGRSVPPPWLRFKAIALLPWIIVSSWAFQCTKKKKKKKTLSNKVEVLSKELPTLLEGPSFSGKTAQHL